MNSLPHDSFKDLIGKTITAIEINAYNDIILYLNNGCYILYVEGDCCSQSEWTDVHGIDNLLNSPIIGFNDDFTIESDWGTECLSHYGFTIITEKGKCSFGFINDSNGYYGGWMIVNTHIGPSVCNNPYTENDFILPAN